MGWSKGSRMMSEIIETLMATVSDKVEREEAYSALIDIFEDYDCDTLNECLEIDEVFDEVYRERYPEEDLIEEEELENWDDQSGGSF
jgi:hypothetical protein